MSSTNPDTPQTVGERFFKVANDTFRAALLGQYGESFTAAQLQAELELNAKNIIPMFSSTDSPYRLTTIEAAQAAVVMQEAVGKYRKWIGAGRPPVQ